MTRRDFLAGTAMLAAAPKSRYQIGITTNTRGGWEKDVFLSFREAHEAGYRNVESFVNYFPAYFDKPDDLRRKIDEIGVHLVTISNGGGMETHFEDASRRQKILDDHLRLVRFIKLFGCDHLKINTGPRRPEGTRAEDLKTMAATFNELGRRIAGEGLKFGVHAHLWTQ